MIYRIPYHIPYHILLYSIYTLPITKTNQHFGYKQQQQQHNQKLSFKSNSRLFSSSTETPKTTTAIKSPKWIRIKDIEKIGEQKDIIEIKGWVRTVRKQKTLAFVEVNDGSNLKGVQCVILTNDDDSNTISEETKSNINKLTTGTSVTIQGRITKSQGKVQALEITTSQLDILGSCPGDTYPLAKKRHTLEYLRTIAHLRPRTNTHAAIARVRSVLAGGMHEFFQSQGFVYVQTPIITASVLCYSIVRTAFNHTTLHDGHLQRLGRLWRMQATSPSRRCRASCSDPFSWRRLRISATNNSISTRARVPLTAWLRSGGNSICGRFQLPSPRLQYPEVMEKCPEYDGRK